MDSKKAIALIRAVDRGSLTAAANELGYTQSGLTHMMNSLEDELGLNLLVRSKSGVRLSPEGLALIESIRCFADAALEIETEADRLRRRRGSVLRLGAYSSIASRWVPQILAEFRRMCPEVRINLTMDSIDGLYSAVRCDELDLAMVSRQSTMMQGLNWTHVRDDELLAVLPPECKDEGVFLPENFEQMDFLMPSQGFELDIAPIFYRDGQRISPEIQRSNLDDASIVSMVRHGLGASVLSELVIENMGSPVKTLPLRPPAYRSLGFIVSEKNSSDRSIRRFIDCAKEVVAEKYSDAAAR